MPTKLNKAGEQQEYVPAGNGDASGEYGNESGSNRHFQSFGKKQLSNFRKQIDVREFNEKYKQLKPRSAEDVIANLKNIKIVSKDGKEHSYADNDVKEYLKGVSEKAKLYETFDETKENGGMSPERVNYDEQQIKEEIKSQAKALGQPKYEKKATFVLGLPASGKSYITNKLKAKEGAFEVDADLMKQRIPEFQKDVQMVSAVHEESSWMSKKMQDELISQGANMIIGKVGGDDNYGSILKMANKLKAQGYKVNVIAMDLDGDKALARNLKRFQDRKLLNDPKKPARIVSASQTARTQRTYLNTLSKLYNTGIAENYAIYDADVNMGEEPKLVSKSKGYLEEPTNENKTDIQVGKIKTYKPVGRTTSGEIVELGTESRARTLHNGLLMETKKSPKEHFYGGSQGNYKIIDEETGTLVGFAKDYEDAIKYSQNQEWIDRIKRAKEVFFKKYPHLKKGTQ